MLVDFLPKDKTINSEAYIETRKKIRARIRRAIPQLEMKKVFLQHDNAQPHKSIKTREAITSFEWITVSHPPYSPDLAPSDYHLFGTMKEELRGKHYTDDEVKQLPRIAFAVSHLNFTRLEYMLSYNNGKLRLKKMVTMLKNRNAILESYAKV